MYTTYKCCYMTLLSMSFRSSVDRVLVRCSRGHVSQICVMVIISPFNKSTSNGVIYQVNICRVVTHRDFALDNALPYKNNRILRSTNHQQHQSLYGLQYN